MYNHVSWTAMSHLQVTEPQRPLLNSVLFLFLNVFVVSRYGISNSKWQREKEVDEVPLG